LLDRQKAADFDRWARLKAKLHFFQDESRFYFQIREIWWASLGVNIGQEEDGKNDRYERPVLILKIFNRRLILVIPLSSRLKQGIYYYSFTFNNILNTALLSQLRIVSSKRLIRRVGRLDDHNFQEILDRIRVFL